MVGRVLLLIAAFVVAGLGALLVYLYAAQADERAAAEFELVSVLVVQAPIPVGTSITAALDQQLLLVQDLPGVNVPEDAVSDPSEVQGLVSLTGLVTGETLVRSRVGDPAEQRAFELDEGLIAVSFPFQDFQKVANFVTPGSEVAVFLTYDGPPTDAEAGEDGGVAAPTPVDGTSEGRTTRMLLDRVEILAVGATTSTEAPAGEGGEEGETETVPATILTVALTKEQSESMVLGDDLGDLYLGLVNDASDVPPGEGASARTLFEVVAQ